MNRVTWHCALCLERGSLFAPLRFAGLHAREIGGAACPCAIWRCPDRHEHWRLHVRIGSSHQPAAGGPVWAGVAVRERLEPVDPWELTRAQRDADAVREEKMPPDVWAGPPPLVCVEAVRFCPVSVAPVAVRGW